MLTDALQDIDQVVVGIDLVQPAGHDQALHDPDVFGPEFGPDTWSVCCASEHG